MEDTIASISTSIGIGAISIVRISGNEAIDIVNKICSKDLNSVDSHTINYAHIMDKEEIIDEVLIMVMRAPKTYTKEDVVEINTHGGINTTNKVLELLLENGARMAEPGEFTKRAFLNGRIDLTQSEAVSDLINAKTDASRRLAINQVNGKINEKINNLRDKMAKLISNIEVNIDYPEYQDELQITIELLNKELREIKKELDKIIDDSKNGRLISNGLNVAIIGKPNVGKSSLLNAMLDENKAIVTNIAGTTRDLVEGSITLNGVAINFIDTAGIRETSDIVEKIGVDKSLEAKNNADLVILVLNNNEELDEEDKKLLESVDENTIVFVNKCDLESKVELDIDNCIRGNTLSLDGIRPLKEAIISKYSLDKIMNKDMTYVSNLRQIDLIKKANVAINAAINDVENNIEVDLVEINIKNAWELLGEVTGKVYTDELVDTIFSNFCLGK